MFLCKQGFIYYINGNLYILNFFLDYTYELIIKQHIN